MSILTPIFQRVIALSPLVLAYLVGILLEILFRTKDLALDLRDMRWSRAEQELWADKVLDRERARVRRIPYFHVD